MKEEKNHNAYAYISIVAIVAIVALFVMFAGSGSKQTQQPVNFAGDLVGDAISKNVNPTIQRETLCTGEDSNGFCQVLCDSGCSCTGSDCSCNKGSPNSCLGVCCPSDDFTVSYINQVRDYKDQDRGIVHVNCMSVCPIDGFENLYPEHAHVQSETCIGDNKDKILCTCDSCEDGGACSCGEVPIASQIVYER